jgi:phage shock protein A
MSTRTADITEKKQALKQNQKAHEAQAKADKLTRKAFDNGNTKKADKAQDKADKEVKKTLPHDDSDTDL